MNYRYHGYYVSVLLIYIGMSGIAHTGQFEPMSFVERVSGADIVILASIDSSETRIVGGSDSVQTLRDAASIFTVLV